MFGKTLRTLLSDRPVIGTFVKLPRAEVIESLARAGYDFAVLDAEHSQASYAEIREALTAARAAGLPVLVRMAVLDTGLVNRLLEAGAAGIQLSDVSASAQASALRAAVEYASAGGARSISMAQPAAGYGSMTLTQYLEESAGASLVVGQLEGVSYADEFDEVIASLDVAFIGPTDLSVSAGTPGDTSSGVAASVIDQIEQSAARTETPLGIWAPTATAAQHAIDRGYRYVVVGSDLALLTDAAQQRVAQLRGGDS